MDPIQDCNKPPCSTFEIANTEKPNETEWVKKLAKEIETNSEWIKELKKKIEKFSKDPSHNADIDYSKCIQEGKPFCVKSMVKGNFKGNLLTLSSNIEPQFADASGTLLSDVHWGLVCTYTVNGIMFCLFTSFFSSWSHSLWIN